MDIDSLAIELAKALGAADVEVLRIDTLVGGAIQDTRALDVKVTGGSHNGDHTWVLRTDAASTIAESRPRLEEHALLQAAWNEGVTVPEAITSGVMPDGRAFSVVERLPGIGLGPKVVKDITIGGNRAQLVEELGRQLACIHRMDPTSSVLTPLAFSLESTTLEHYMHAELTRLRDALDELGAVRPALERGISLAWNQTAQWNNAALSPCMIHRDFRTGNLLLDEKGLQAVLDWEFAGVGDPMFDIGWFCARCWRFSRPDLEAGGLGHREDFYRGYRQAGGSAIDTERVRFWEIFAHLRWATIALQQGARHARGEEPSLALALTGRIADSLERDALAMLLPTTNQIPFDQPVVKTPTTAGTIKGSDLAAILGQSLDNTQVSDQHRLLNRMSRRAAAMLERESIAQSARDHIQHRLLEQCEQPNETRLAQLMRSAPTLASDADTTLWQLASLDAWVSDGDR